MATDVDVQFGADFAEATRAMQQFRGSISGFASNIKALLGAAVAVFFVDKIIDGARKVIGVMSDLSAASAEKEKADALLANSIKNVGSAFDWTAEQVSAYAAEIQQVSVFGDESIKSAQQQLIQYKLTGQAFKDATMLAADMASAMGTDITSAATKLGQTLANPARGLMMLKKEGLLTAAQTKELQKEFAATGDKAALQAKIIEMLGSKYEGAAAALAGTTGGMKTQIAEIWGDVQEELGDVVNVLLRALLPAFREGLEIVRYWAEQFSAAFDTAPVTMMQEVFVTFVAYLQTAIEELIALFSNWELTLAQVSLRLAKMFEQVKIFANSVSSLVGGGIIFETNTEEIERNIKALEKAAELAKGGSFADRFARNRAGISAGIGQTAPNQDVLPTNIANETRRSEIKDIADFLRENAAAAKKQQEDALGPLADQIRASQEERSKFVGGFEDAASVFKRIQTAASSEADIPKKQLTAAEKQILKLDEQKKEQAITNSTLFDLLNQVKSGVLGVAGK